MEKGINTAGIFEAGNFVEQNCDPQCHRFLKGGCDCKLQVTALNKLKNHVHNMFMELVVGAATS